MQSYVCEWLYSVRNAPKTLGSPLDTPDAARSAQVDDLPQGLAGKRQRQQRRETGFDTRRPRRAQQACAHRQKHQTRRRLQSFRRNGIKCEGGR
jgi:hypothetical protein